MNHDKRFFLDRSLVILHAKNERTRKLKDEPDVPDFGELESCDTELTVRSRSRSPCRYKSPAAASAGCGRR